MDLKYQAIKIFGKNRRSGVLTQVKKKGNLIRFCDRIQAKYGLEKLINIKTKHILGVIDDLKSEGKSQSTLAGYATTARDIAFVLDKQNIVPRTNREMGISRAGHRLKPVVADTAKTSEVTARLHEKAVWLGLASELRAEFGLRARESLLTHEVVDGQLNVEGAKGGRPRLIPIRTEAQRALVERVQRYINEHHQRSLIPNNLTLRQGYNKQKNALSQVGATKDNNAHSHSTRHKYAQNLATNGASKSDISEELGHSREDVVAHYLP